MTAPRCTSRPRQVVVGEWVELRKNYIGAIYHRRVEAFYGGVYHDDIPGLVQGVAEYIRAAGELAQAKY